MGRRRKGRDIHGWVIVDKPSGIGSTDVVGKLRWAFEARKAGHAGTLDPAATGLLAVALGEATKTIPFVTDARKCYDFMIRFGAATSTDDAEGEVIASSPARPPDAAIRSALAGFTGDILQRPPRVSAVKIGGARAYDLARRGAEFEPAARPLSIESLELIDRPDPDHALLRMICGKGGYVRSIARDLGASLGCLGHVLWLRRIWSEPFDLTDACSLGQIEDLARAPGIGTLMRPLEAALAGLPRADVTLPAAARLSHGNAAEVVRTTAEDGDTAWAAHRGQALAIGIYRGGLLYPSRVLQREAPC